MKRRPDWFSIILFIFELVGVARMGYDTYLAVGIAFAQADTFTRTTSVLLIDGIMGASLLYVAFASETSPRTRERKKFLSVLAWAMYALQFAIGYAVGGWLGLAVRVSVGAALLYHTAEFAWWRLRAWMRSRPQDTRDTQTIMRDVRQRAWRVGYRVGGVLLWPVTVVLGVVSQIIALVVADMIGRVLAAFVRGVGSGEWAAAIQTPTARIEARSTRAPDPHNASYALPSGEWMSACVLCGDISGPHPAKMNADRGYASHTQSTAHNEAAQRGVRLIDVSHD